MSAYSTLKITRSAARRKLLEAIMGDFPDALLERFLDDLLEPRLYNAVIVSDSEKENDDYLLDI